VPAAPEDIPAGATPGYVQMAPNGRFAYICNRAAGYVSVLDTEKDAVVGTIPIPQGPPQYVSFTPDSKVAFVSVFDDSGQVAEIVFVDTRTKKAFDEVHVSAKPFASAVAPDGETLWVPSHDENVVDVIDVATGDLVQQVQVAPNPHWVTFSPDGKTVWTANHMSNRITAIDTRTYETREVGVGTAPHSLEVSPDGTRVAVVDFQSSDVTIVDTATMTVVGTVPVGTNPQDVAWSHDGNRLYTVNNADNSVSVVDVDTLAVVDTLPVDSPTSIAISKDGGTAYVTSLNTGTVRAMDLTA
jgi:serine/threonine-protein kinase